MQNVHVGAVAHIQVLKAQGSMCHRKGCPIHWGKTLCPLPHKCLNFRLNMVCSGALWSTVFKIYIPATKGPQNQFDFGGGGGGQKK